MKFSEKYPDAKPRVGGGEEYEDCMILGRGEPQPCHKCGDLTQWIEINFAGFFCSEECLAIMDAEFMEAIGGVPP